MVYECLGEIAENPYIISSVGIGIRTIEELAFFIKENPLFIDDSIYCSELCVFIDRELGLKAISDKLGKILKEGKVNGIEEFAACILENTGFADDKEIDSLRSMIKLGPKISLGAKMKLRGDIEMKYGHLAEAAVQYNGAIDILDEEKEKKLASEIYHNAGTAFARLFYFKKAAEYYKKAYEIYPESKDSYEQYLFALKLSMDDRSGEDFASYVIKNEINADDAAAASAKADKILNAYEGEEISSTMDKIHELEMDYRET
ncbi:MAG: tetratricopeptide repeat protein [Lachnospiraceae bacterium]|nr:tetratricopeptide repeat protein [Lachnospiraceae bacterium]